MDMIGFSAQIWEENLQQNIILFFAKLLSSAHFSVVGSIVNVKLNFQNGTERVNVYDDGKYQE